MNQESQTIDLRDEYDLDDYHSKQIEIEISSYKHTFPFIQIFKYSERIQREYENDYIKERVKEQIKEAQRELNISDKSLGIFIELLKDQKVEISNESYLELNKLSKFFEIHPLTKLLKNYAQGHSKDVNFIIQIILSIGAMKSDDEILNEINTYEYEKILQAEINECLINDKFGSLPISTIHRIMKGCDMQRIDQRRLYDFIMKKVDERSVLFSFLCIDSMDEEIFNALYSKYEESNEKINYEFIGPNLRYIKELRESKRQLEERIKKLESSNATLEERSSELKNENEKLLSKVNVNEQKIQEISKMNEESKARINDQESSNNQLQSQVATVTSENDQLRKKIEEQESKYNELQIQFQQLKNENERVKQEIKAKQDNQLKIFKEIPFQTELIGVFNYLRNNSNIKDEIQLTHSPSYNNDPNNIFQFENIGGVYGFEPDPNAWICFEFKKHKIILSNYTIRSYISGVYHPKSWIIEGSNDYLNWTSIDEQNDCQYMNGRTESKHHIYTFQIQKTKQKPFKYIKMTHIGKNWGGNSNLVFNCIEFYGQLL